MHIDTGLFDHMVLQRTAADASHAHISGTADRDGTLVAFVTDAQDEPLDAFLNEPIGEVTDGRFNATLSGLPVGGPYKIQLSVATRTGKQLDSLLVQDVLVGDVWLLGGQSNMQGVGLLADRSTPHDQVRAFYMDDHWAVAEEPLHDMSAAVDPVHAELGGGVLPARPSITGVGPGHVFGLALQEARQVPQGLIACAHGGTSMRQWNPGQPDDGGKSLYGALLRRYRRNGGAVAGLIWYQGESDANAADAPLYTERMVEWIAALRRDTGQAELPVAIVQISRVIGWSPEIASHWNSIQDQQRRLPDKIDHLAAVPAIDLSLDDSIHVSGRGMKRLGRRLADAMQWLTGQGDRRPIELVGTRIDTCSRGLAQIVVTFDHVVGSLQAGSRPWGFAIGRDMDKDKIWDVRLDGNEAILGTGFSPLDAPLEFVSYGKGTNPCCTITDEADRSLPVFGPLPIGKPRALTEAIRTYRVSPLLPGAGKLTGLERPDPQAITWETRTFDTDFASRHDDLATVGEADGLVYYACTLTCSEAMPLTLILGYDGPLKVWFDELEVYIDPEGVNPGLPVKGFVDLQATAGQHTLLIALGANQGRAWGIYLRLMRPGVDPEVVLARQAVLPQVSA